MKPVAPIAYAKGDEGEFSEARRDRPAGDVGDGGD